MMGQAAGLVCDGGALRTAEKEVSAAGAELPVAARLRAEEQV
jgi:hypothetical protein